MADKKMYKVGITVKEPWASDISYEVLDITLYAVENGGDGCSYIAIKANQGVTPGTDDTVWVKATQRGQSIYDLAVKYGDFEGTEAEFEAEYEAALHAAQSAAQSASAVEAQVEANEAARATAEQSRVTAERARSDAETARSSAETARINAENARNNAESLRDIAESDRVRAEAGRVTAEASRVEAETFRQGAEQSRRQQFEALKTDMNTAIANVDAKAAEIEEDIEGYEANEAARVSAEQSRVSAESSRVSAESARATAETARETQASSDHTRAETDHGTAASDHTTAQADHTQAASDHTDITRARLDAETATSEANMASLRANGAADTAIAAAADATEAAGTIDAKIAGKADESEVSQLRSEVEGVVNTDYVQSPNLFDKTAATPNYYVNANTGALAYSTSFYATDYIPIDERGLYCYLGHTGGSAIGCAVYNSEKVYIRGAKAIDATYQEGDAYVRFTIANANIDSAMCVAGTLADVPAQYVPYGPLPVYSPKPSFSNILKLEKIANGNGYVTEANGKVVVYDNISGGQYTIIPVKSLPVGKMKISCKTLSSPYNLVCVFADSYGDSLGYERDGTTTSYVDYEVTIPSGTMYVYVNSKTANEPIITIELLDGTINKYILGKSINGGLLGKKCVCFGDSITWYDGRQYNWGKEEGQVAKGYETYLRGEGMLVQNEGFSGANILEILSRIRQTDVTGYDFVTITSGANDSRYQLSVGALVEDGNVFDETTFIGALQAAIVYVLTNNPTAKILLMTPIKGWIYYPEGYINTARPLVSGDGIVEKKYADAIKAVAAFYSLPVCDWYNEAGVNLLTRSWFINDPDPDPEATPNPNDLYSLHPTAAGYKRMADVLIPVLRNM